VHRRLMTRACSSGRLEGRPRERGDLLRRCRTYACFSGHPRGHAACYKRYFAWMRRLISSAPEAYGLRLP
jgi:hypothetical protein